MKTIRLFAVIGLISVTSIAFAKDKAGSNPDTNGDGQVSTEELSALPEKSQSALKKFDKDGDGALNAEEFKASKEGKKKK
jgi:EF hand